MKLRLDTNGCIQVDVVLQICHTIQYFADTSAEYCLVDGLFYHVLQQERPILEISKSEGVLYVYHLKEVPFEIVRAVATDTKMSVETIQMLLALGKSGEEGPELPRDQQPTLEVDVVPTVEVPTVVTKEGSGCT